MIPFRLTQQQFRERYQRCLDRAAPQAISRLRELFALAVEADTASAEVQIFVAEDDPYEPSVWIYFSGKNNKVDSADPSLFPGRSIELSLGLDSLDEFDSRFFTTEKFGGKDIVADALKSWVAECWWKAGGWNYPIPAILSVHDAYGDGKSIKLSERDS